jgi:protein SFI1
MHAFQPTRASPPARRTRNAPYRSPSDLSVRSEQQLKDLSPDEIDFLDAVFERAGPKAVGFMPVFEAYNVVLAERGLAQDEVVGYAKLLKVGNWRGETWQEKWNEVKGKFGYNTSNRGRSGPSRNSNCALKFAGERHKQAPAKHRIYQASKVDGTDIVVPQYHNTPKLLHRMQSPCPSETTIDLRDANLPLPVSMYHRHIGPISAIRSGATSIASEDNGTPSTTPPSYKTTEKEVLPISTRRVGPVQSSQRMGINSKGPMNASAARKAVAAARERKGSVVNENEAWKKIQMERDEKEAQLFYQDKLLERCWGMWKNGHKWVIVRSISRYSPSCSEEFSRSLVNRLTRQEIICFCGLLCSVGTMNYHLDNYYANVQ